MSDAAQSDAKPAPKTHPTEYEIIARERVLDAFFKVDKVTVTHQRFDGETSTPKDWLVFERGDAAAALLFDADALEVILVDQFRIPTVRGPDGLRPPLGKGHGQGWLLETVAGIIPDGTDPQTPKETPETCITREIWEEAGYQVTDLVPIAQFFSSPGGTSERIFLFYAEVREAQRTGTGGGVDTSENIEVVKMPLGEFLRRLDAREFLDPKTIIAGMWLRERRQAQITRAHGITAPELFRVKKSRNRQIGYLTGDIEHVKGIDVWVNPENTDMMMDRFFDRSVSAKIRYLGARKFVNSPNVDDDLIADELATQLHRRKFVKPATVIDTASGMLKQTHGVQRIFHVAAVTGVLGQGVKTDLETIGHSVDAVLAAVAAEGSYRSVLIPMIGTGAGGFHIRAVAPRLVERTVAFFERNPRSPIEKVLLLGYSVGDGDVLLETLTRMCGGKHGEVRLEKHP